MIFKFDLDNPHDNGGVGYRKADENGDEFSQMRKERSFDTCQF